MGSARWLPELLVELEALLQARLSTAVGCTSASNTASTPRNPMVRISLIPSRGGVIVTCDTGMING